MFLINQSKTITVIGLPILVLIVVNLNSRFCDFVHINGFYRTSYALRGICHGPVSVCLCMFLSQVGVLIKRLNVEEGFAWTTRSVAWELIPLRYFEQARVVRPN